MVKVVGRDETLTRRISCRNCGSILEYLLYEVRKERYRDMSGTACEKHTIECPKCKEEVFIKET